MKLGLYVHIPFCKSKCYYCDFLSFPKQEREEEYVEALIQEMKGYGEAIKGIHTITSIFIGGGTPTVLSPFLLGKVCQCIADTFEMEEDLEWTVEANPGTITKEHARVMKECGVNRVSLGLQACQSHLLKAIGRIHEVEAWKESVDHLKEEGIENINTDLMFGLPEQTIDDWKETLKRVASEGISHISAYGLIIEEDTPFYDLEAQGKLQLPTEEEERQMYEIAKAYFKEQGYTHYEISNWSKQGKECQHNILYWEQGEYIGVGLGAHGYLDGKRYHNTLGLTAYIETQGNREELVVEEEVIDRKMQMEEFMFLGLRLVEGIDIRKFEERFSQNIYEVYGDTVEKWIKEDILVKDKNRIFLSEKGRDISNQVMSSFLLD